MAMPDEAEVLRRLSSDKEYPLLFKDAFPQSNTPVTYDNFARAIAAFERTLITRDRFDDFLKGDDKALNTTELKGLNLFLTVGCTTCHIGPTLGGNMYQKMGLINPYANTNDVGRIKITNEEWDEFRFKVPSLRNITLTWPYFHDGQSPDLDHAITTMAHLQLNRKLDQAELTALKAFLNSLTDKTRRAAK
jgi:cytochrome c peroxidase